MNNGRHKGGSPQAWQTVHETPGVEDLWQLHYAMDSDKAHNSAENLIANVNDSEANYFKLVAQADGSFTIQNSRNNFEKSYAPLKRNPTDFSRLKHGLDNLDSMMAGNLFVILYRETKDDRYKRAATQIRERFDTYPRTKEGAFWHGSTRQWQTWLDGIFMSMPLLVRYGQTFNDSQYADDEATKQILLYAKHQNDPKTGLMFHAY